MNKKIIVILSSMLLILGLTGCKQQEKSKEETKLDFTMSDGYIGLNNEDVKIIEWANSEKEPDNPDKNGVNFMGDVTNGALHAMSKTATNIKLNEGQSLRIETETKYPITVMLKDNSNEQYVFNKTLIPVDGAILVDAVQKKGEYELMVDFNEIDEFKYQVYIANGSK